MNNLQACYAIKVVTCEQQKIEDSKIRKQSQNDPLLGYSDNLDQYWKYQFKGLKLPKELEELTTPMTVGQSSLLKKIITTEGLLGSTHETSSYVCSAGGLYCENLQYKKLSPYPWPDFQGFDQAAFTQQMITAQDRMEWFSETALLSSVGGVDAFTVPVSKFSTAGVHVKRKFLPRSVAKLLGDVTEKNLPSILKKLNIQETSILGRAMVETSRLCEKLLVTNTSSKESPGQSKACTKCFEDTIDFIRATVNRERTGSPIGIKVWRSFPYPATKEELKSGTILKVVHVELKSNPKKKIVINCHSPLFPYRIGLCHFMNNVNSYLVILRSTAEPSKSYTTMAFCHTNTKNWDAQHVAFRILGGQPGKISICHWADPDDLQIVVDVFKNRS